MVSMVEVTVSPSFVMVLLILLLFVAATMSDKLKASHTSVAIAIGFVLPFLRTSDGLRTILPDSR